MMEVHMPDEKSQPEGKPAQAKPDANPNDPGEEFANEERSKTDDRFNKDGTPAD